MDNIAIALYQALRDDSEASVGIRALLGNTTSSPYNVYHAFLPESVDFSPSSSSQGYIVYSFISGVPDNTIHEEDGRYIEELYQFMVYHRSLATVESVHRRIKWRLQNKRSITAPTSQAVLLNVKLDSEGPPTFDDVFKVWFQQKTYRAWVRDDDLH